MHLVLDSVRRIGNGTILTKAEVRYHTDVIVSKADLVSLFRDSSAWLDRFRPLASRSHKSVS